MSEPIKPADLQVPRRLIEAFARGEVTRGGLAEAGWFEVGTLADDSPLMLRPADE